MFESPNPRKSSLPQGPPPESSSWWPTWQHSIPLSIALHCAFLRPTTVLYFRFLKEYYIPPINWMLHEANSSSGLHEVESRVYQKLPSKKIFVPNSLVRPVSNDPPWGQGRLRKWTFFFFSLLGRCGQKWVLGMGLGERVSSVYLPSLCTDHILWGEIRLGKRPTLSSGPGFSVPHVPCCVRRGSTPSTFRLIDSLHNWAKWGTEKNDWLQLGFANSYNWYS